MAESAEIVICGAGIAGVAAAWALAERGAEVLLVDERPPLSLTSDKSTECYRNFWPGPGDAMVRLMNRSIDLIEGLADESGNVFGMNRRGYLYATRDTERVPLLRAAAEEACGLGAGPLRIHRPPSATGPVETAEQQTSHGQPLPVLPGNPYVPSPPSGYRDQPNGADLILDHELIRRHFPYLDERVAAVLHARRCGWLSAQQLGAYLLDRARASGVRLLNARVTGIDIINRSVQGVRLAGDGPAHVRTSSLVNAAGPMLHELGGLLGLELPVFSERHRKLAFEDRHNNVPRDAPMLILADPLALRWTDDERELLGEEEETRQLLERLPAGAHCRPEGHGASQWVLALWAYDAAPVEERFPLPEDEQFAEIAMRGVAELIPGLQRYVERPPRPVIDGGYYTKTRDNRPLIGPTPVRGAYLLGALSGYGIMAACGAAELLASQIEGAPTPDYAPAFALARFEAPAYRRLLETWDDTGQL